LNRKKRVYAHAGINEYWIVDLKNTELIVFRQPSANDYKSKDTLSNGIVIPIAFSNILIEVGTLLKRS
jgi:Uma2 family endonuclease